MRISKVIQIGRFEGYVGYRPQWSPEWRTDPTAHGYAIVRGRWHFVVEWRPSKREQARRRAERLAEENAKVDECLKREAAVWPAREVP